MTARSSTTTRSHCACSSVRAASRRWLSSTATEAATSSARSRDMIRFLATLALCGVVVMPHASAARPDIPTFRHVLVVVFENKERDAIVGTTAAPTFDALARRYATLSKYHAVAHPSLPNYLALVSGSTHGIRSDCTSCVIRAPSPTRSSTPLSPGKHTP